MEYNCRIRMAVLPLCLALVLAGCAPGAATQPGEAMGRYVEEVLPLPQEITALYYLGLTPEGDFLAFGLEEGKEGYGVWRSADGGQSWQEDAPDWLGLLAGYDVDCFVLDNTGIPWFTYEVQEPEEDAAGAAPRANPLVSLDGGTADEKRVALQSGSGNPAQGLQVGGGLVAASYGGLGLYDITSGARRLDILPESYLNEGEYLLGEGLLAVVDGAALRLYNTEDGRQSAELALETESYVAHKTDFFDFQSGTTVLAHTGEEGVLAYCNSAGIYRLSSDGLVHERVLDGGRTSLIQPTTSIKQLFVRGEDYYVYVTHRDSLPWKLSGAALLHYRYDGTVPTFPTVELRVAALQDSPTARQAAAVFQQEHHEVQVRVEVALDGNSAVTREDALHVLSAELLAGRGPDVLVLDGMPVDSYRKQGALLDLRPLLSGQLETALLPNVAGAYEEEGRLWAVPTRFSVPMLLAQGAQADGLGTLSGFSAQVSALDSPQLGMQPQALFSLLYFLYSEEWYHGDGTVDEQALARSLEEMGAIMGRYDGLDPGRLWDSEGDARVGAIGWIAGWTPFYLGDLAAVEHLAGPYTAVMEHGAVYTPYPDLEGARIRPRSVSGVSAATTQPALATAFVECMLSEPVQAQKLGDGLPVRAGALRAGEDTGLSGSGRYGVSFYDDFAGGEEKGLTVALSWPEQDFFRELWDQMEALEVAPLSDATVEELVWQEAQPYFFGRQSLEETVQSLRARLQIYLDEK